MKSKSTIDSVNIGLATQGSKTGLHVTLSAFLTEFASVPVKREWRRDGANVISAFYQEGEVFPRRPRQPFTSHRHSQRNWNSPDSQGKAGSWFSV